MNNGLLQDKATSAQIATIFGAVANPLLAIRQVQIDRRFLSISGDVCCHEKSLEPPVLDKWKAWASIAQKVSMPRLSCIRNILASP